MTDLIFEPIENPKELRKKLGMNQLDFWGKVGVTQSGGSRYEAGRSMPKALRELVRIIHIRKINMAELNQDDLDIANLLKRQHPDLYKELKKQAKIKQKN